MRRPKRPMPTPPVFPPLIVILGPTAVGKTALSLTLCERFDGEIVSADSRQIYRGMDIGTDKASPADRQRVPHHLLDLCTPDEVLTLATYQQLAYAAIDGVHARGRVPFLVGGTALYVRAVVQGLRIPAAPPDPALRAELEAFLAEHGRATLFDRLRRLDPRTAAVIDGQNPRRVLRALEIFLSTGRSKVDLEGASPPPYRTLLIGLDRPRTLLYRRIDQRVDSMFAAGLVEETRRLLDAGYGPTLPAMTGLGYREVIAHLRGELTLAQAVERVKVETHRFVRHQYTWFRRMPQVQRFDLEEADAAAQIRQAAGAWLQSG